MKVGNFVTEADGSINVKYASTTKKKTTADKSRAILALRMSNGQTKASYLSTNNLPTVKDLTSQPLRDKCHDLCLPTSISLLHERMETR